MANVIREPRPGESGVLHLDTAADNIIIGLLTIQTIIWEPVAIGDTCQIENSSEVIKLLLTAREIGTATNIPLPPVVVNFPLGFKIDGLSLGALGTSNVVTVVLK